MLKRYPYPGKFEGGLVIDEVAYIASMDGCDEDLSFGGDCYVDWYGLLVGDFSHVDHDIELDPKETEYLATVPGCIIHEDNQGFVYVAWYESHDELMKEWRNLETQYDAEEME